MCCDAPELRYQVRGGGAGATWEILPIGSTFARLIDAARFALRLDLLAVPVVLVRDRTDSRIGTAVQVLGWWRTDRQ